MSDELEALKLKVNLLEQKQQENNRKLEDYERRFNVLSNEMIVPIAVWNSSKTLSSAIIWLAKLVTAISIVWLTIRGVKGASS